MRVHNYDTVESRHTQQNFCKLCYPDLCKTTSWVDPESRGKEKKAEAHTAKQQAESTQKADARRKKEAEAHAAKQQTESTEEADATRKTVAKAQAAKRQAESTQEADARRELPIPLFLTLETEEY